jgi:hypothetical protein
VTAARIYGRVTAAVIAAGRKPRDRAAGLMIAAITGDLPMYTTDPADFTGLDAPSGSFLSPGHLSRTKSQHTA